MKKVMLFFVVIGLFLSKSVWAGDLLLQMKYGAETKKTGIGNTLTEGYTTRILYPEYGKEYYGILTTGFYFHFSKNPLPSQWFQISENYSATSFGLIDNTTPIINIQHKIIVALWRKPFVVGYDLYMLLTHFRSVFPYSVTTLAYQFNFDKEKKYVVEFGIAGYDYVLTSGGVGPSLYIKTPFTFIGIKPSV
ncbi:MAG: hypothetical protein HYW78_00070, partial [Parcubacteria group bacterium]|nr:hypothetical protein [Parcubacteria group bacterium]